MTSINGELIKSLNTGCIDKSIHSNKDYRPQLLLNDKETGKKVLTDIIHKLNHCDEFWFSVAFITTTGVATLINTLVNLESKGVKGKILVSQYLNFTQPEALKRILQFNNIELKIVVSGAFHSKGYLFKKNGYYDLIIGSSNLTASALCVNKEWNLKLTASAESGIIDSAIEEFSTEFNNAVIVDKVFIATYEVIYNKQFERNKVSNDQENSPSENSIKPNTMQVSALENIEDIRFQSKNKALLISATGTGKTYLSAFDIRNFKPKKMLFVVHRANIAEAAMKSYQTVFGSDKSMGMYSGDRKELDKDFIFSTIQTISKSVHYENFAYDHFDYIVIDETHRAGAKSYQNILEYFTPKFLLGMTATPERTDGIDIFKLFNHTIAYEIRLHQALEENMLSPFHYYGITDITVNNEILEEDASFNLLTSDERIDRIIDKINLYGSDDGKIRGLVFCSKIDECIKLSSGFNERGFNTVALTGNSSEDERSEAINRIELDDDDLKIDYIFTVDIFNEGVDIPRINQIIMLRPTQSAIVFVQQLGRGLRKVEAKSYLTVMDFIGNYNNCYLVPIALYGDTSYNKDSLRKLIASESSFIPGESTINFDQISKKRIFESIATANMQLKKDLVKDYELLKFKLGHTPMMMDFIEHGSRDPQLYVNYSKSFFNFVKAQEGEKIDEFNANEKKHLELLSSEINNSKRVEESIILREIIINHQVSISTLKALIGKKYNYVVSDETIASCINNLNLKFVTESFKEKEGDKPKKVSLHNIYNIYIVNIVNKNIVIDDSFLELLNNKSFSNYLMDSVNYSVHTYDKLFDVNKYYDGLVLYRKYSRKDVFRILNWDENPVAQNVGGYMISPNKSNCPIFVNYHKDDDISDTTKYDDGFIDNTEFEWMSKSKRTLKSPDVQAIINYKSGLRLPLFIKKDNGEGSDFYYMGDITPIDDSYVQTTMPSGEKEVSVVKMKFSMNVHVEDSIYNYLTHN